MTGATDATRPAELARATVVVPAHDEERTIGRLLDRLVPAGDVRLHVVVVANGCTDDTADVARRRPGVDVVELADGNKQKAMRRGVELAGERPVVFADADVLIDVDAVVRLIDALDGGVEAAAPRRVLDLRGASWPVRSYYRVWSALPQVEAGLFGRGVIALSPAGRARVAGLPHFLSDDLALSESFGPDERVVVEAAEVVVYGPRTTGDLLRRRERIVLGNREFDGAASGRERTGLGTLVGLARRRPALLPDLVTFVAVTVATRIAVRRRRVDDPVWLRDNSSRER